ncbi:hypothetical protein C489_02626 [Natrinema versiforme JCM 10478]|uniref:Uncharacterized protein n=1 Tax=Natrinema versiforme JCM 10478 TaxID=1227496 RepID=L9Y8D8_9EURY|nr:hypothetical protein C489_02626 [Natrinema versiforme JCM 10478]
MESPERVCGFVVHEFESALLAVPLRVTSDFEPETFPVPESVLVFEFGANRDFEPGTLSVFEGVLVVADVGSEDSSVFLVAPVPRWRRFVIEFPGVVLLVATEE